MQFTKKCAICGDLFISKGARGRYCKGCKTKAGIIWDNNRVKNAVCEICGREYYKRPCHEEVIKCCCLDCKLRYWHKNRRGVYWKCVEEERGISLKTELNKLHNTEMRTILEIAEMFNTHRTTITRWFKKFGIKHRSISEDNYRRYSRMTPEEIKEQTRSANIKMRELMRDPDFKNPQIKKVMMAQCYGESKIEKDFKHRLLEKNNTFESQYQIGSYFADIAFPQKRLVIEIDGDYWHNLPEHKQRDKIRDEFIKGEGWEILRIKEGDIRKNMQESIDRVIKRL